MGVVAVTGGAGATGQRALALLCADETNEQVLSLDLEPSALSSPRLSHRRVDLLEDDLKPHFEGIDVVVHAAWVPPAASDALDRRSTSVETTRRVLDAAGDAGVVGLVLLSSATVYGAWSDNPVPLTEDAPLRPSPGFPYAVEKAEIERLGAEWRDAHPGTTVAVLRPTVCLSASGESWLAEAVGGGRALHPREATPPAQFLHPDDLAAAIALAVRGGLDGAFNVAPDGWIPGETARALGGGTLGVGVPAGLLRRLRGIGWALRLTRTPPTAMPYTLHPWVVANDRLRAVGWTPAHSNEEALVAGRRGSWWRELSPNRRQELALGATGGTALLGVVGIAALLRRRAR